MYPWILGYHAIGKVHDKPDEEEEVVAERGGVRAFDMPELIHNLNLLVDMTEEDIVLNERRYGIVVLVVSTAAWCWCWL